jgi:hypothetical protein
VQPVDAWLVVSCATPPASRHRSEEGKPGRRYRDSRLLDYAHGDPPSSLASDLMNAESAQRSKLAAHSFQPSFNSKVCARYRQLKQNLPVLHGLRH